MREPPTVAFVSAIMLFVVVLIITDRLAATLVLPVTANVPPIVELLETINAVPGLVNVNTFADILPFADNTNGLPAELARVNVPPIVPPF